MPLQACSVSGKRGTRWGKSGKRRRRFLKFVNMATPDECWNWVGSLKGNGYGQFNDGGPKYAHRVAYELFVGPVPEGKYVCHTCDNRRCVNPRHLWIGDQLLNLRDMMQKGRGGGQFKKGHVPWCKGLGKGRKRAPITCDYCGVSAEKRVDHLRRFPNGPHFCSRYCATKRLGSN